MQVDVAQEIDIDEMVALDALVSGNESRRNLITQIVKQHHGHVLPSDMVDNSFSPCERLSGWFSLHSACQIGCFILSLSIPICSHHH